MTRGLYESQINRIGHILEVLHLEGTRILHPVYPKAPAAEFRRLSYLEIWQKCYSERYYHFELVDHSLLQFRVENFAPLSASYSYYEVPYFPSMTFEDFLLYLGELADTEDEVVLRDEYENYVSQHLKDMCTPIRYDYDVTSYVEGRHPVSHIHFGHKSNIRVGTTKVLRPLSFLFFVLRQSYPDAWQQLTRHDDAEMWMREVNESLELINPQYSNKMDRWDMSLS